MTRRRSALIPLLIALAGVVAAATGMALLAMVLAGASSGSSCSSSGSSSSGPAASIVLGPAGSGVRVGATEYGGPGDPSSGVIGSSGANLLDDPDSYAELGGDSFQTATAMGGLPYMTPLRITWGTHSAIAYKRDIGFGGGPIEGYPRAIDLWWEFAGRLGIPYESGMWSGPVEIERAANTGAASLLGNDPTDQPAQTSGSCTSASSAGLPITPGPRATLLPNGLAAAPAGAPAAIKGIIAAGNQIVGKPYVYGGGHGLPLSQVAPSYDCSSSVSHLLWGGGLLPATGDETSGELESWGLPGPGRWVTLYASAVHVFMYVAGLRWDTHNAAGPGDGSTGIGWHPLIRSSAGFVARHPAGL
jgi:cell wall-associated NlpC family hydrolase